MFASLRFYALELFGFSCFARSVLFDMTASGGPDQKDTRVRGRSNKVSGGWPHCFKLFLRSMCMGHFGLSTSGVPVDIQGEVLLLHGRLTAILGDGDGHAKAFDWKGASSLKPCLRHFNVYRKAVVIVCLLHLTKHK